MRLGLLGLGAIAGNVIEALKLGAPFSLRSAHDVDRAAAQRLPEGARFFERIGEFLADPGLDVVFIATPTPLRAAHVAVVAEARKPMIIEKPAATSLADYERLQRAVRTAGVPAVVALHASFGSEVAWAREQLQGACAGLRVSGVESTFHDPYAEGGVLGARAASLANSWLDSGPNALSILCTLFPQCEITRASLSPTSLGGAVVKCAGAFEVRDPVRGAFRFQLLTDWTTGLNSKQTIVRFEDGGTLALLHSEREGALTTPSGTRTQHAPNEAIARLPEHYVALLRDAAERLAVRGDNWDLADRVHLPIL